MPLKIVSHRRRREGRTDYRRRLRLLKSGSPRLVVRRSSKSTYCQLVEYGSTGDRVLISSSSGELQKFGWLAGGSNLPGAYLTGLLCGVRAKGKKFGGVVLDVGLSKSASGSLIFSTLKGLVDGGLDVSHSEDAFPSDDRVSGKHISNYASRLKKEKPAAYKKQFSGYLEKKANPEDLPKLFEATKAKILSEAK